MYKNIESINKELIAHDYFKKQANLRFCKSLLKAFTTSIQSTIEVISRRAVANMDLKKFVVIHGLNNR